MEDAEIENTSSEKDDKKNHPHVYQNNKLNYRSIVIVIAIIAVVFLIGYVPRLIIWRGLEESAMKANALIVSVIEAKRDKTPINLILPSTTQALRETPIWARINGYIKNFYADIGDFVNEGQLLVEIETPEINKELDKAVADLSNTLAKLEIAKITALRWEDLSELNAEAVSTQEVDTNKANFNAVAAEVNAATANAERLEKILGFNKVVAPFSGVITTRNIDIGTLITAGSQGNLQQIFQIAKIDVIRVFVNVPQPYFRLIKIGGEADITVSEYPNKIFKGIIARTARALDPVARTLLTEVHVNNKDQFLITGLFAEVSFNLIPDEPYFIIPTTSLIIREGRPQVGIVDHEGIVHLKHVKIGRDYGKTLQIIAGLHENDKVITNPNEKIVNGVKVAIAGQTNIR